MCFSLESQLKFIAIIEIVSVYITINSTSKLEFRFSTFSQLVSTFFLGLNLKILIQLVLGQIEVEIEDTQNPERKTLSGK